MNAIVTVIGKDRVGIIADVTALVDLIMDGGADADTLQRADVDGNGVVGISDVTALVDMILS